MKIQHSTSGIGLLRGLATAGLSCCLAAMAMAAQAAPLTPEETARVDAAMGKVVSEGVPGLSIAIVRDGQVAYVHGYGVRDRETGRPVTADTRMEIGSVTKQFTAAAVLQLAEQGKLSLDDRVTAYVPEYPAGKDITLRQLLWQVSGVPEYVSNDAVQADADTRGVPSAGKILDRVKAKPMDFPPGDRWAYSNSNYFLLGLVVERVSGRPFDQYVRDHVLRPAGMSRTTTIEHEAGLKDMAAGYVVVDGHERRSAPLASLWAWSAGNLVSDVGDMVRWDEALFGGKVVRPESLALMTTPGRLANGKPTIYGMGWAVTPIGGQKAVWHTGGTLGFGAMNAIFPDRNLRVVVLMNSASKDPGSVTNTLVEALYPDLAAGKLTAAAGEDPAITRRVAALIKALQAGSVPDADLTDVAKARFTPAMVKQVKDYLQPMGDPKALIFKGVTPKDGSSVYAYLVRFEHEDLSFEVGLDPQGRLASVGVSQ